MRDKIAGHLGSFLCEDPAVLALKNTFKIHAKFTHQLYSKFGRVWGLWRDLCDPLVTFQKRSFFHSSHLRLCPGRQSVVVFPQKVHFQVVWAQRILVWTLSGVVGKATFLRTRGGLEQSRSTELVRFSPRGSVFSPVWLKTVVFVGFEGWSKRQCFTLVAESNLDRQSVVGFPPEGPNSAPLTVVCAEF